MDFVARASPDLLSAMRHSGLRPLTQDEQHALDSYFDQTREGLIDAIMKKGLPTPRPSRLTPRQMEVIVHWAQGDTNTDIARSLAISRSTVSAHVTGVHRFLHSRTQAHAVALAYQRRFLGAG